MRVGSVKQQPGLLINKLVIQKQVNLSEGQEIWTADEASSTGRLCKTTSLRAAGKSRTSDGVDDD